MSKEITGMLPSGNPPAKALDFINKTRLAKFYDELKALEKSRIFSTASTERERALLIGQLRLVEILAFGETKTPLPPTHHA